MTEIKRLPATFGIRFGLLADSLAKQIKEQRLKYDPVTIRDFERLREAINTLYIQGLIVDTQQKKLILKLYNKILRHVGKENKCSVKPLKN